ncbi:hypothetical protein SAMN03080617_00808 [Algoriphagus alkaliphilus]|uniref:Uncharacterized protein n=1 Tax=Algoriphagus alkaliphilus TaxID=279824 RepID=A0A1G5W0E1_9BACT|nr:hypothetical protein [Algoriphagus alkaliphilus]SDA51478.1 hypothetical protein SAMN03080617_00808 [Algoriphagus alkaliphilus]
MEKRKAKSLIGDMRTGSWSEFLLFLLVANFINLSANFYEGNIFITKGMKMDDPIDTFTELIFEWVLDGSKDLIPDNGTQQDDNSLKKIKLALIEIPGIKLFSSLTLKERFQFFVSQNISSSYSASDPPPPDRC